MASLFRLLDHEHRDLERLVTDLVEGTGAAVASRDLARRLVHLASRHEFGEETVFWPEVRRTIDGGGALERAGLHQEALGKSLLKELAKTSPSTSEFTGVCRSLQSALFDHIMFEEAQVWPRLMASIDAARAEQLGGRLTADERFAPIRPHPDMPSSPGLQRATGLFTAGLDRAIEAVSTSLSSITS